MLIVWKKLEKILLISRDKEGKGINFNFKKQQQQQNGTVNFFEIFTIDAPISILLTDIFSNR